MPRVRAVAADENYRGIPRQRYHVDVVFTELLLGGSPLDPKKYAEYIGANAPVAVPTEDEVLAAALAQGEQPEESKVITGFLRVDVNGVSVPAFGNWVIKGWFKEKCGALRLVNGTYSAGLFAYKGKIDALIEVQPRWIPLVLPEGTGITIIARTLRAETMRGPRVAIARSESLPPGTTCSFDILVDGNEISEAMLREWLTKAQTHGMGQWRNGGWGVCVARLTKGEIEYLQPMDYEQAVVLAAQHRAQGNVLAENQQFGE